MKRVLIANRGEIALRAIRACRKNGLETVAVFSSADGNSPHVWAADHAVCIGPPAPALSYLDGATIIGTAKHTACDAVYPGYGFLSERASFAQSCAEAGLVFVGPSPESIAAMGDKAEARKRVAALGIPVVPGSPGAFTAAGAAAAAAASIGFPLLLKARAGGGGRGMRVASDAAAFGALFEQASAEAQAAFGNGEIYLERFFSRVRHIEVQVFGDDHGNYRHFWERDCSVQRRHQKLVEEAPSPVLSNAQRKAITDAAVTILAAMRYRNAGTIEFIFDMETGNYFFIEMNTRIQVEHPVTEMLTGHDLVSEQLRVAAGEKLSIAPTPEVPSGAVIEWRICAEDPARKFQPTPGTVHGWPRLGGPGIRFDTHVYDGYAVPPYYDSMLGKLIVMGADRPEALARSAAALAACATITGISTTVPFHRDLLRHPEFTRGAIHTGWVDEVFGL
jgi:acetyl-CoA carboxylase biotin carboxylase subunit